MRSVNGTMVIDKRVAFSALLFRRCTRTLYLNHRALLNQWRTQEFCWEGGGVQQIQLRTEVRKNGDLGRQL